MTDAQASDYYFDSYAHFGIHEEMLKDRIRTEAYRDAIFKNPSLVKDKIVLDVGCGTGILSMFAARAGAKHVYAVEKSGIIDFAREIIETNGLSDKITVYQGTMEEIELPEKVDLIISEWMGYALLYESMLPSVISARDRYMKPGGTMFPSRARMYIAGIEDKEYRQKKIEFWDNVYGFDYAPIKRWALTEPLVEVCPEERIITEERMIADFDLNTVTKEELIVDSEFTLYPVETEYMHAFLIWFDVLFEGGEQEIELTTSPYSPPTHWSQSIFYLENPVRLRIEHEFKGKVQMVPNDKNPRDQDFKFVYPYRGQPVTQSYKLR